MAQLHYEQFGSGPKVILLHGWGMNSKIWQKSLLQQYDCQWVLVDLPGHGQSARVRLEISLENTLEQLKNISQEPACWIGWSLGGMFALAMAQAFPARVRRLGLIASTPRFVQGENWPFAVDDKTLQLFRNNLSKNYRQTIKRFIALQFMNVGNSKQQIQQIQQNILQQSQPDIASLSHGLEYLKTLDLRQTAGKIKQPVSLLFGDQDKLVPQQAIEKIQNCFNRTQLTTIVAPKSGHIPFINQPDSFNRFLHSLLNE